MPKSSPLSPLIPLVLRDLWLELRALSPREAASPPLPGKDKALLAGLLLTLLYLLLAMGSTRTWAQLGGLLPVSLCLLIAFWPSEEVPARRSLSRLLRFPIFWAGLVFLLILLTQALNPAWFHEQIAEDGTYQLRYNAEWVLNDAETEWVEMPRYVTWLPHGIQAPFQQGNPYRSMVMFFLGWGLVLAMWCGISRRRTLLLLAWGLSTVGLVLCLLIIAQFVSRPSEMLWMFEVDYPHFVGPFIYRNHAAAYLCLLLVVNGALALHYLRDARMRLQRSDPSGWFLLLAGLHWFTILLTVSRGGFIIASLLLGLVLTIYFSQVIFLQRRNASNRFAALIMLAGGLLVGGYGLTQVNFDRILARLGKTEVDFDISRESRANTIMGTLRMFEENRLYGVGGYGFRWIYPVYQKLEAGEPARWWDHAHSDILEYFAEYGIVGMFWWIFMLGYWWYCLIRDKILFRQPLSAFLALGTLILLFGYGSIDFPFRSGAVFVTWAILLALSVHFPERERRRRRGGEEERPPSSVSP